MDNYDHHNGKTVKSVEPGENETTITFETGDVIRVPGEVSSSVVGQALLLVEPGQLVFGAPQASGPAIRQTEIPVPEEPVEVEPVQKQIRPKGRRNVKGTGGRQSRSKGKNA